MDFWNTCSWDQAWDIQYTVCAPFVAQARHAFPEALRATSLDQRKIDNVWSYQNQVFGSMVIPPPASERVENELIQVIQPALSASAWDGRAAGQLTYCTSAVLQPYFITDKPRRMLLLSVGWLQETAFALFSVQGCMRNNQSQWMKNWRIEKKDQFNSGCHSLSHWV